MSNNISDEQLIMNLKFDETSGTVAADTSPFGSNNVGELRNGAEFVQEGGDFGGVVRFDGKNDYIHINDAQELNIVAQAKRTVSVWFKVENQDLSTRKQVIYEEGGSGTGLNIYLHAGKLYIGGWIINSGWQTYLSTTEVASNTWHHVAVVLNADPVSNSLQPGVFKGYLDGHEFAAGEGLRLNGRSDDVGIGAVNQNTVFHDGAGKLSGSHALAGNLEDLRVYNRVLTQEEISSLYEEKIHPGEPTPPPPPTEVSPEEFIMQLKFDETSGIVAADTSPFGSNNVGELRNGAAFVEAGGDFGGVVSFDGKDDYIHINDAQELNIVAQAKRTVSVWFKVENKDISTRKQVIYEEGGSTTGINIYVHGGSVYVGGWNTGKGWQTYLSSNKIANETWHHVAVVVDTDLGADWVQAGKFRGYLDGDEFAAGGGLELGGGGRSDDVGIGALNQNTKFHDGAGIFSGSHAFAGNLEDLR
ncbi:MAG: LamG domain-containing protein, partial [Gomphosphaeria aponina SAG 52.96 = DSM 107014]|nr:LamG domain-containing protein [Gomphosphaeria aponina SAG 52.96 = DSM 107014]